MLHLIGCVTKDNKQKSDGSERQSHSGDETATVRLALCKLISFSVLQQFQICENSHTDKACWTLCESNATIRTSKATRNCPYQQEELGENKLGNNKELAVCSTIQ